MDAKIFGRKNSLEKFKADNKYVLPDHMLGDGPTIKFKKVKKYDKLRANLSKWSIEDEIKDDKNDLPDDLRT